MDGPPEPRRGADPSAPAPGAPNTLADSVEPNTLGSAPGSAPAADSPVPSWGVTAGSPPRRRVSKGRLAFLGVFGAIVAIIVKYALGLLVAGAVIGVAGSFFGGPWDRLPSDVRNGYEARLDKAIGNRFDGLSDADKTARLQQMVTNGLGRLDDQQLEQRFQLQSAALGAVDAATCGRVASAFLASRQPTPSDVKAMIGALDGPSFQSWAGVIVVAVEAEAAGSPAPRTASDVEVNAAFTQALAYLTASQTSTLSTGSNGGSISDGDACDAVRALYRAGISAGGSTFATLALLDVAPQ